MHSLRQASKSGLDVTVKPSSKLLHAIPGRAVVPHQSKAAHGHSPGVLYIGADYCPYCAALRWPLVLALMRFGHFRGLHYMKSSTDDVYSNTVTFSFHQAHYRSRYLVLQAVEIAKRNRHSLDTPDARQKQLFKKFDAKPYAASTGGIPFLYMGGYYMESGAPYSPGMLKGLSWHQVAARLNRSGTPLARKVLGVTNLYTAAICKLTRSKPSRVCTAPGVKAAKAALPIHL